jgi:hypothetical protein
MVTGRKACVKKTKQRNKLAGIHLFLKKYDFEVPSFYVTSLFILFRVPCGTSNIRDVPCNHQSGKGQNIDDSWEQPQTVAVLQG